MRGFIITLIIFSILIACIVLNHCHAKRFETEMLSLISKINGYPCDENNIILKKIKVLGENNLTLLSLCVNFKDIDNLYNAINCCEVANSIGDQTELLIQLELIKSSLKAITRHDQLSLKTIL